MTSPSPSEPRTASLYHALDPVSAGWVCALAVGGFVAVQAIAMIGLRAPLTVSVVVGQITLIAIPLVYVRRHKLPVADVGIRRAAPRYYAAAALCGSSLWLISLVLVSLINPPDNTGDLQNFISQPPLWFALMSASALGPLGEELVFRGVLARSLVKPLGRVLAIAISAVLFSVYHLSLAQAVPTLVIGLALALVAIESGSIWPGLVLHALNNTIVVVLARDEIVGAQQFLDDHAVHLVAIALALAALGGVVAWRRPA